MKRILFAAIAALIVTPAYAQRCGSMKGEACVTCCQGTGRSASQCQSYCASSMTEKRAAASKDTKRTQCLAQAGIAKPPPKVLPHCAASTGVFFSEANRTRYAPFLGNFSTQITFEEIEARFPLVCRWRDRESSADQA